jgi:hypothetical protein
MTAIGQPSPITITRQKETPMAQNWISKKNASKASKQLRSGSTKAMRQVASMNMNLAKTNTRAKKK